MRIQFADNNGVMFRFAVFLLAALTSFLLAAAKSEGRARHRANILIDDDGENNGKQEKEEEDDDDGDEGEPQKLRGREMEVISYRNPPKLDR